MARVSLNVNLDDVETGIPKLPPANYLFKVTSTKRAKSRRSGNAKLQCSFEVLEPEEFAGKRIPISISLADNALFSLKEFMIATGVEWDEDGFDDEDFINKEFIGETTLDDEFGTQIAHYHKVGDREPKIFDEE